MKITELDGQFIGQATERSWRRLGNKITGAQGVMFQCPVCAVGKVRGRDRWRRFVRGAHYILCWFRNPVGAEAIPATWYTTIARWQMSGTSLDDLTLEPSINLPGAGCKWHGYLRNGDAA